MVAFGRLYIVATPIGNLGDITQRALEILRQVDLIAAEDTRHSRVLLDCYQIKKPALSLHDYNERDRSQQLVQLIKDGKDIALISDAGTPLISDPGYVLVREVRHAGVEIIAIPGPCAIIAALSIAGLPTDQFRFLGFLPASLTARRKRLQVLAHDTGTLVFYEAPHRLIKTLEDMIIVFDAERQAVLAKELTKKFETVINGSLSEIKQWLIEDVNRRKGEFVLLVHGAEPKNENFEAIDQLLKILLEELPMKQAVDLTAKVTGGSKNRIYKRALNLKSLL